MKTSGRPKIPTSETEDAFKKRTDQVKRESREHEEPTTSEMAEETYSPKMYRNKGHGRIPEHKAEALKKDRRKKYTLAKFVGGAENTAHPRVAAPELRPEFELCKPSRGRKRGLCWCVDKYGLKLPGTDYVAGDLQCHNFDSGNTE
ncbi:hypothetical protein JD844_022372 [Phrynosoma platyrhinos]|uniref:Thyroglobulin type-1 domain-containing protein n=1 Tax=Phrynosoma platyrhinos TaxID=52577 RepID=A0ABQ7SV22_PHRPL|nr:hypothetical protein JD844_022372 [Phrynosoma platyrhinos]